jgi:hypothetical protein
MIEKKWDSIQSLAASRLPADFSHGVLRMLADEQARRRETRIITASLGMCLALTWSAALWIVHTPQERNLAAWRSGAEIAKVLQRSL